MKILILGGGFVGGPVATYLASQGHHVSLATRSGLQSMDCALAGVQPYGLRVVDDLPLLIDRTNPEVIVHLAGPAGQIECDANPRVATDAHVTLTAMLADIVQRWQPHLRVIYGSSHLVFEGTPITRGPCTEDSIVAPTSLYASLKVAGEALLRWAPRSLVLRLPNFYAGHLDDRRDGVVERMLRAILARESVRVNRDGGIDLLHVEDFARLVMRLLTSESKPVGIKHVSGEWMTVHRLGHIARVAAESALGRSVTLDEFDGPYRVRVLGSDFDGWKPRHHVGSEMERVLREKGSVHAHS